MTQYLKEMARDCLRYARSPHVVGAGIGVRFHSGCPAAEPTLTLLVDRPVPRERLLSTVKSAKGKEKEPDFDVLEVGDVRALSKLD